MTARAIAALCFTMMITACGNQTPPPSANNAVQWPTVRDEIVEDYLKTHPNFAVVAGRHEYDGQLPHWSGAGIAAEIKRLHAAKARLTALADRALDDPARLERDILISRMERDLFWLETAEAPFTNPAFYLDWMVDNLDPSPYLTRTYAPLDVRMRAYTKYAQAVQQAVPQIRANLRTPLSRPLLERGVSAFKGFASFFKADVPGIFASVQDQAAKTALTEANATAATAVSDLAAWLESQRPTATASFALGPEKFAKMLNDTERVTTPLAELEAAGRADLERNQAALTEACAAFAPGATVPKCIEKMGGNKPTGGAVAGARMQLEELRTFVREAGVATIPSDEQAKVNEAPPYARDNFAYIDIPGPYEKGTSAVYYIAPPDPSWPAKEQRDYLPGQADLLFTSVHEVWPGHFLQFLHSNRNPSIVGRLFVGYAFAEGWAHYAEEAMWDMGLGKGSPETHIGQLSNALLRNARFLSAIGLHTKGMTVADSERLFREQAFTDAATARQQAARGTYDPAYLNYTMGKLMIRKLRDDWTATRGGQKAWRDFHDRFLTYGGPPIPMVRQQMMGNASGSLF
jgi:uncharacterized protein (DUF885 family)